ncbi:MAG: D-2-hydroxyacid dehydrogenase family protein [Rhizobiales bacterium]|nr:D-2-hydroxyacid dehydrogenase family protein [Hyphomicrobiales bacterium]
MIRCAILDDYQSVALALADWGRLAGRVGIDALGAIPREDLAARLAPYDAVIAMRERTAFDATLLAALPRLKLIVTTGMRNAAIDVAAASARGIVVCGTQAASAPAAEMTWALLLALMRRLPQEAAALRADGPWQSTLGRELAGRALGIVGLGKLGAKVASYGRAFDMRVIGWTRTDPAARCAALGIEAAVSLDDLLARADVVSLHATLTPASRGMIGARELGLMKPEAVLVNTARGPLVDEAALVAALEAGRLSGAALDVFDREPLLAGHPFRRLPNVVATPHLGYVAEETYRAWYGQATECLEAWLAGAPVRVLTS